MNNIKFGVLLIILFIVGYLLTLGFNKYFQNSNFDSNEVFGLKLEDEMVLTIVGCSSCPIKKEF